MTGNVSSETLSQNQIDQLLERGAEALRARDAVLPGGMTEVQVYDFRRPHRVSRERLRALEAMYERLVKSLESWLIARMRGQVELRLQSIETIGFGEFAMSLPTPCASYLVSVKDSGGMQGVIDIGYEFAFTVVDRLFGGTGDPVMLERGLTPIERQAVRGVSERIAQLLEEIWEDHVPLDLDIAGFETVPDVLQAVNREDPVLVATVEATLPGDTRSLLVISLPFVVLDKFFGGTANRRVSVLGPEKEREASRGRTEASVRGARVMVRARLPQFRLSLEEITALRVGSVVSTGIARDSVVQVLVSGQHRFEGSAGRVGSRLAIHVQNSIVAPDAVAASGAVAAPRAQGNGTGAGAPAITPIF